MLPRVALRLALVFSFFMALIPLGHKLPAFGPIPSIGPFEVEPFRGGVLALCILISIIVSSFGIAWGKRGPALRSLGFAIDAVLLTVGVWACWRFYVDVTFMRDNIVFFQPWQAWTALGGCAVIIILTWRLWGGPLALVALVALVYFLWSFSAFFVQAATENLWMALDDGVLGNIMSIVLSTVFPFIILGAMLESSGAGSSLIKIAFLAMRRFRGGPAHAAVLASALFGTVSGSAVANVVGTGVITIPLIKRRGFHPAFAGGVEATASTGGQVMPPIMGAAALVMADFVGVTYLRIIIAAILPALAYYAALFASVVFESRRLGMEVDEEDDAGMQVTRQDYINLTLVGAPLAVVIIALIMGASPAGSALTALAVLIPLSFINPAVRRRPFALIEGFAEGGLTFAKLMIAVSAIGIVVASLSSTGLPTSIAIQLDALTGENLLITLIIAALGCIALGMGMPTLPAYLTIIVVTGSAMLSFGLTPLTAHFFVFYFGVASAITPPVAIAAYAAAAIAGSRPIETGVAAVKIGIVIFAIPFMFAFNPELLLISEAGREASALDIILVILRTAVMTYMLASAASRFDLRRLTWIEVLARLAVGLLVITPEPVIYGSAIAAALALVLIHVLMTKGAMRPAEVR